MQRWTAYQRQIGWSLEGHVGAVVSEPVLQMARAAKLPRLAAAKPIPCIRRINKVSGCVLGGDSIFIFTSKVDRCRRVALA
jgi:hypothetical protein